MEKMNTTNGHDKNLVAMINHCYSMREYRNDMEHIVYLLAHKYADEFVEKICPTAAIYANDPVELIDKSLTPRQFLETYGGRFLCEVCDDEDLKVILAYCRYDQEREYYKVLFILNAIEGCAYIQCEPNRLKRSIAYKDLCSLNAEIVKIQPISLAQYNDAVVEFNKH